VTLSTRTPYFQFPDDERLTNAVTFLDHIEQNDYNDSLRPVDLYAESYGNGTILLCVYERGWERMSWDILLHRIEEGAQRIREEMDALLLMAKPSKSQWDDPWIETDADYDYMDNLR